MSQQFDVIVIGGGPAGYICAIRAAQLGMGVACIDAWVNADNKPSLGGTCVNVGCIPSKALLESSEAWEKLHHEYQKHGISVADASFDVAQMHQRKDDIVKNLTGGVLQLFKGNGIAFFHGTGKLNANNSVEFSGVDGSSETLQGKHIIVATGSKPVDIPVAPVDGDRIVDNEGALKFSEVPKTLGVIGGGVIGLELGSVWRRLGAEVTVIEAMDDFLFIADSQIQREAQRTFKKQGMDIKVGARVTGAKAGKKDVAVNFETKDGADHIRVERLIVCVGRRPNTDGLIGSADLELDERGFVVVDAENRTNLPGVYAIGDVVRGPMLAHKGMEEGVKVAEIIAGKAGHVNYDTIPSVIYTWPEIAWVGKTEQQVKEEAIPYRVGTATFMANGRAKAMEAAQGTVKIIAHQETDEVLGVHIIGPNASELIQESVSVMEFQGSSEDIARTMHAHPTLSEVVHEAALSVDERPLHGLAKKRR